MKRLFPFFFLALGFLISCGVKGRPLPPLTPREIGYGKPQYKGANQAVDLKEETEDKKKKKGDQ